MQISTDYEQAYSETRGFSDDVMALVVREIEGAFGGTFRPATFEEDTTMNFDGMIRVNPKGLGLITFDDTIAVRVRNCDEGTDYLDEYPDDITIRSRKPSGARTELDKWVDGTMCDYLYYGFYRGGVIAKATIYNARKMRNKFIEHPELISFDEQMNNDGTGFRWFNARQFRDHVLYRSGVA